MRCFVPLEGVGEVVEDELVEVALRRENERKVLKRLCNCDDSTDIVRVVPVDDIRGKYFLILARSLITQRVNSLDEVFDRRVRQLVKASFGVSNVEIKETVRVLLVPLFVKDFQCKGLEEDAIPALVHEVYFVECAEHVRQCRLDLDGGNCGDDVEFLNCTL